MNAILQLTKRMLIWWCQIRTVLRMEQHSSPNLGNCVFDSHSGVGSSTAVVQQNVVHMPVWLNVGQMCKKVLQCVHVCLWTDRGSLWRDVHKDNPSISQKTVSMTLSAEGAALNFFCEEFAWCYSNDSLPLVQSGATRFYLLLWCMPEIIALCHQNEHNDFILLTVCVCQLRNPPSTDLCIAKLFHYSAHAWPMSSRSDSSLTFTRLPWWCLSFWHWQLYKVILVSTVRAVTQIGVSSFCRCYPPLTQWPFVLWLTASSPCTFCSHFWMCPTVSSSSS